MEIIDLKKLNVNERLNIQPNITIPKLNDRFLLTESFQEKPAFLEKRQLSENLKTDLNFSELMHKTPSILVQAENSWKEIEEFEFKNLDIDNFYNKEMKRVNRLLI